MTAKIKHNNTDDRKIAQMRSFYAAVKKATIDKTPNPYNMPDDIAHPIAAQLAPFATLTEKQTDRVKFLEQYPDFSQ